MSTPARLLLSSLAPSAANLPVLSLGLLTWHDHLWARVSALLEDRVDLLLERCGGFWENGVASALARRGDKTIQDDMSDGEDVEEYREGDELLEDFQFKEQIQTGIDELRTLKLNEG